VLALLVNHALRQLAIDNLETILLSAGISFPQSSKAEWQAARDGGSLPSFQMLGLDSLGLNELSISLELVSGIELTTSEIFAMDSLEDLVSVLIEKNQSAEATSDDPAPNPQMSLRNRLDSFLHSFFRELAGALTAEEIGKVSLLPLARLKGFSQISTVADNLRDFGTGKVLWSRRHLKSDALIYTAKQKLPGSIPIVFFGGVFRRPGMPASYFLKGVEGFTDTVILLRTKTGDGFRSGIRGLGSDLPKSLYSLASLLRKTLILDGSYVPPLIIGMSAGGIPALIFSSYTSAQGVLLVGPQSTNDSRWSQSIDLLNALKSRKGEESCHVRICYGENSQDSLKIPSWTSDIANCSVFQIPNSPHAALFPLFSRGELGEVLRSTAEAGRLGPR